MNSRRPVNSTVGCLLNMILYILLLLLLVPPQQAPANPISDAQKKQFIELLKTLPHKGEFFTDDAVKAAGPYLPVLFVLTDKDIEGYDIYPFAAISRGLCDVKEHRLYATDHFGDIRHSEWKLFWAAMLVDAGNPTPEIVRYLRAALNSEEQAKLLAEMAGPNFADLKRRINTTPNH